MGTRALTFRILDPGDQITFSERAHDFVDASITQTGDLDDERGWHDFVVLGTNFNLEIMLTSVRRSSLDVSHCG